MSDQRPSSMDLMLYADGELEPGRQAEVEAYLERSPEGRALVASFLEMGDLVREHSDEVALKAGADSIVDAVMDRVESEPEPESSSGGRVVPLRVAGYALGTLAAAAAVALFVWQSIHSAGSPRADAPIVPSFSLPATSGMVAMAPTAPVSEEDQEPGVSVDAIDFGTTAGTIFYVPSDTGYATAVVWLTDDEAGGTL